MFRLLRGTRPLGVAGFVGVVLLSLSSPSSSQELYGSPFYATPYGWVVQPRYPRFYPGFFPYPRYRRHFGFPRFGGERRLIARPLDRPGPIFVPRSTFRPALSARRQRFSFPHVTLARPLFGVGHFKRRSTRPEIVRAPSPGRVAVRDPSREASEAKPSRLTGPDKAAETSPPRNIHKSSRPRSKPGAQANLSPTLARKKTAPSKASEPAARYEPKLHREQTAAAARTKTSDRPSSAPDAPPVVPEVGEKVETKAAAASPTKVPPAAGAAAPTATVPPAVAPPPTTADTPTTAGPAEIPPPTREASPPAIASPGTAAPPKEPADQALAKTDPDASRPDVSDEPNAGQPDFSSGDVPADTAHRRPNAALALNSPGTVLSVKFAHTASTHDIMAFLMQYNLTIADGPSPEGRYRLRLSEAQLPKELVDAFVKSMRTQTKIVEDVKR